MNQEHTFHSEKALLGDWICFDTRPKRISVLKTAQCIFYHYCHMKRKVWLKLWIMKEFQNGKMII